MTEDSSLLDFVSAVSGDTFLKVEETLGDGYVRLKVSEAERRQAKHDIRGVEDIIVELLRNSRDAHAQRIFVATGRDGETRLITIVDDGVGVPDAMRDRIFEPRVTSKLETMVMDRWGVHGRGMALFSIKSNTLEAAVASTGLHKGAAIRVVSDPERLPEKADQSTWPTLEKGEDGAVKVARGPHNLIRRTVEFALEHPGVDVYFGSPTEILATMVLLSRFVVDEADLMFCDDLRRVPVWQRPGASADAAELADVARELGLEISERSAHRILGGEVAPLSPVLGVAAGQARSASPAEGPDIYRDRRGLKIHAADIDAFSAELEKAFDSIAERYYLQLRGAPRITVGRDDIRVRFEVDKED